MLAEIVVALAEDAGLHRTLSVWLALAIARVETGHDMNCTVEMVRWVNWAAMRIIRVQISRNEHVSGVTRANGVSQGSCPRWLRVVRQKKSWRLRELAPLPAKAIVPSLKRCPVGSSSRMGSSHFLANCE